MYNNWRKIPNGEHTHELWIEYSAAGSKKLFVKVIVLYRKTDAEMKFREATAEDIDYKSHVDPLLVPDQLIEMIKVEVGLYGWGAYVQR